MITRDELILKFMLALVSGIYAAGDSSFDPDDVFNDALVLANKYLENLA